MFKKTLAFMLLGIMLAATGAAAMSGFMPGAGDERGGHHRGGDND
jgi:hypothetical protein